jgi:hypothetical protein
LSEDRLVHLVSDMRVSMQPPERSAVDNPEIALDGLGKAAFDCSLA